jgi:hypothetical protein
MTGAEIRRWARIGAEARLAALEREIAAIYQVFPELRSRRSAPNPYTAAVRAALRGAVTRHRTRRLSPQARKRMAEAQRRRWAELKAMQAKTEQGDNASAQSRPRGRSRKKKLSTAVSDH